MAGPTRSLKAWSGVYALTLVAIALWPKHIDSAFDVNRTFVGRWLLDLGLTGAQTYRLIEFSSNVVLYVPLGVLAMAAWPSRWWVRVCLLAGAVSGTFELLQRFLAGRTASLQDVVANTLGGAIGAALVVVVRAVRQRRSRGSAALRTSTG